MPSGSAAATAAVGHQHYSTATTRTNPMALYFQQNGDTIVKFGKDFTVGGWSACVAKTLCAPVERIKLILQLQSAQPTIGKQYNGIVDCMLRVPREQGFLSLWRGNWSNILRASSQESLGIAFKEFFRRYTVSEDSANYTYFVGGNLLAGGLSGCATFCFIYPLDFARTRLAVDMGKTATSREFHGLSDCLLKISKSDGFFGLYRGFFPSLQFIFLYRSVYYGLFDTMKFWMLDNGYRSEKQELNDLTFTEAFLIGQVTTFIASMTSYPLDTVRRRLTMDAGKTRHTYSGTLDCAKKIYVLEGGKAFFNGALANSIRGIGGGLILGLYNEISKHV